MVFRRQSSQNLLLVGQNEQAAQGVLCSCVLSLAAERPPDADPHRVCAGSLLPAGWCSEPARSRRPGVLSGPTFEPGPAFAPHPRSASIIDRLPRIEQRQQTNGTTPEPILLITIWPGSRSCRVSWMTSVCPVSANVTNRPAPPPNLPRFCGTARRSAFTRLSGSTITTICRARFQRPQLRDFGYRVLFQMSAVDSSQLMDSTAASLLGGHRAILYQDASGEAERFRPYRCRRSMEGLQEIGMTRSSGPSRSRALNLIRSGRRTAAWTGNVRRGCT